MPRPPLPIGTWGEISTWVAKTDDNGKPISCKSQARFRDHDGRVRPVSAFGKNKTAAERALLKKLQDRARTSQSGELTAMHKITHLLDLWEKKFKERVADGKYSPTSLDTYRRAIKNHVRPAVGDIRIGEATTPRIDTVLSKIKNRAGAPTAKTCRAILSGALKLAVRYGAISVNPVREVDAIETQPKNPSRSLTGEEVTLLRKHLTTDERAVQADLPDLVTFMLGTGVRIGEALAVLWSQVDLEAGTVEITSTIVRVTGQGLLRKRTKSRAGQRLLHLPDWASAVLRTRHAAGIRLDDPIFADVIGGFRDPSNVRRSLRTALSPVGSTARRDLGLTLRALRRETGLSRKQVAEALTWPQTRIEPIETGRIKVDHQLVADLVKTYGIDLDDSPALLAQVDEATRPAPADKLAWIRSHALRKTTATALDQAGHTARQIADQLGQAKVSITQDVLHGPTSRQPSGRPSPRTRLRRPKPRLTTRQRELAVVVFLDPGSDAGHGRGPWRGSAELELDRGVPGFDDRIVQCRSGPAHGLGDAEPGAGSPDGAGGVFTA
ncbi:phage integrase family protein [Kribbella sp. VKM Ac-2527]|uniref:Phage integrase family protein n=1 Tax=Kribbella caucasensis TaxID=2512215 RepID=A0A4R6J5C6_9ACTN|nr:helix-turn-helix domain-containing protein [Kribbella sp. VKM Ac-2527]TDO30622.1 phage integrase family protein [Kribbella sp. VKM Ac-2527]